MYMYVASNICFLYSHSVCAMSPLSTTPRPPSLSLAALSPPHRATHLTHLTVLTHTLTRVCTRNTLALRHSR